MRRLAWSGLAALALVAALAGALTAGRAAQRLRSSEPVRTSTKVSVNGAASAERRERRSVAGIVRDRHGTPIVGAEVGSSDWSLGRARTDAAGRFELSGIESERIALYALADGLAPARAESVAAGSRDIVLVAQPPSKLSGLLRVPQGSRVLVSLCRPSVDVSAELCVARRLFAEPAARYELERLAPGDYVIVAELEGHGGSAAREARRHSVEIPLATSIEGPLLAWP